MNKRLFLLVLVCGALLLKTADVLADVDVNVYDDVVYLYLDKLAASNLIKTYSPNQRPLTRFAVAKLVNEAQTRCEESCATGDKTIITELGVKFSRDLDLIQNSKKRGVDFVPIQQVSLSWTATNQPESAMPNNNMGPTGGTVQPLLSYNNGQHYLKYANFYLDSSHYISASPYFSAYIQPQFYSVSGGGQEAWFWLWRSYVKAGVGDFEFQIGRDDVKWGPGEESLMFSTNFKGLDMIRLSTPYTFRLPWVFKHLGQWRFTTFFALLGNGFSNPNTILSAYRFDWQPTHWLDLGFDSAVMMGGRGAIDPTISGAVNEYVTVFSSSGTGHASSNHVLGFDFTARIPPLAGMEFYGKVLLEDTTKKLYLTYINDGSWLAGLYFPKLESSRKWSLRSEFVHTGQIAYRHGFYTSGWSLDGKFMGYDAGSDTYSINTTLRHQFNYDEFVAGSFRYLSRSSDTYAVVLNSSGQQTSLATTTQGPSEDHFIFKLSGTKRLTKWLNVYGDAGLDRVINRGFNPNSNAVNFSTLIKLSFHDLVKQ